MVSLRALEAGALLARRLGDATAVALYATEVVKLSASISSFWAETPDGRNYYRAIMFDVGLDWPRKPRTSLDSAYLLSVIHTFDLPSAALGSGLFNVSDPKVLSTVREYVRSFEGVYQINQGRKWTDGWAVGRYAEDTYDGVTTSLGNPWYAESLDPLTTTS